ncbi:Ig-like domain-containing protein [Caballeronia sp. KNU42]
MSQTQDKNALFTDAAAAPAEPLITTIVDAAGPLAGYIPPTGLASDAQPTVLGTGVAGNIINLYDNNVLLGTALVNSTGRWSFQPQTPLSSGKHEITATQSDGVHTSAVAESYPFSVAQIMVTGVTESDGTAVANGGTAHGTITVTGWIADANIDGSHIALFVSGGNMGTGTVLFSQVTVSGNTFSAVISQDSAVNAIFHTSLADGTYHIDAAANTPSGKILTVSDPRMGFNVTEIWAPAPTVLGLTEHTLNGLYDLGNGDTTHDASPTFALVTVAGDTYSLYDNGTLVASVVATSSQMGWTVPALSNGVHNLSITHTNAGGTSAPTSWTVTVDATPPAVPVITTIHDATGPLTGYIPPDGLASDAQPKIMGTGHAGDTINVFDHTTLLGTALVDSTGRWNFTPQTPLAAGAHELFATQSDGVHTSAVAESYPFTLAQIMVTGVTASDGTAIANGGAAHGTITVTGWIADANIDGSHIALYVSGGNMGTGSVLFSHVTVSGNTFSAVVSQDSAISAISHLSMADGTYHIDAAANTSSGKVLTVSDPRMGFNVTETWSDASVQAVSAVHTDAATAAATSHTVDLSADPASFFKSASAHIAGSADGVHTLHLTSDHGVLDLTSLSGKTAAAKVSGIDTVDLGGAHNALKLSLTDVLNLGQPDLFQHDGKQQMVVQGSNGDSVDLSNAHIAGVADGQWQQHGATQVGGVTYNVYEHSGAHAELLVQQGVQIALHG